VSDDLQNDAALLRDFLTECGELLQQLDQDLMALASGPGDAEVLNRTFRAFHTIKGTSGFMGFQHVVSLTHSAEDVLNLLRKGERSVTPRTVDVLLAVSDQLRVMMDDIGADRKQSYDVRSLLTELNALQAPQPVVPVEAPRLGEILSAQQIVSPSELDQSLRESASTGKRVGEILIEKKLATPAQVEDALSQQKAISAGRDSARTIRVDVAKLDELVNLVGELVLERNRLVHLSRQLNEKRISSETFESDLTASTARLNHITDELQQSGMRTRMVPVDMVFRRLPRLVRGLAASLGKQVELKISGEDTEIDKTMVEEMADPLVHLVRNSLDHGIEAPDVRHTRGKPRVGVLSLSARPEGDNIVVELADDGGGIDPQRVGRKAIERGMLTAERLESISHREILDLIFLPGFSTAEKVSDVSGRGVGMDVVLTNLKKLGGIVQLDSELGRGTCVTLRLPLTLAVLPVLVVRVQQDAFALPLRSVVETARVSAAEVHRCDGGEMLRLRDQVLPMLRLGDIFGAQRAGRVAADQPQHGSASGVPPVASSSAPTKASRARAELLRVVVMGAGGKRVGLVVDQLLGQEETVIKPLDAFLRGVPGLAGATISGDGRVQLILDPASILAMAANPGFAGPAK